MAIIIMKLFKLSIAFIEKIMFLSVPRKKENTLKLNKNK